MQRPEMFISTASAQQPAMQGLLQQPLATPAPAPVRVLLAGSGADLLETFSRTDGAWSRVRIVGVAPGAAHALYLAGRVSPDVLVLECPEGELAPLDALTALGALSPIAVILFGLHGPERARAALSAGAAAVVEPGARPADVLSAVLHCCRVTAAREAAPPALHCLTERECEVVRAVVRNPGAKYLVIGGQLGISEHTVHNHLSNIYQKLNLVNRADLLLYAVRHRIVPPEAGN
jgi:NarL family two-component system response regulator LiaR